MDGEDVPALLRALSDESAAIRMAACEALHELGGPRLPPSAARWAHWWRGQQRAGAKVNAFVQALCADPEARRILKAIGADLSKLTADLETFQIDNLDAQAAAEAQEPGQTLAEVYVVARDLRGGQAVFGPIFVPLLR